MNASGVVIPIDRELLKDLINSHFLDNSLDSRRFFIQLSHLILTVIWHGMYYYLHFKGKGEHLDQCLKPASG